MYGCLYWVSAEYVYDDHAQRDLRAKSARIADLQAQLRSVQMQMDQTIAIKNREMMEFT